MTNSVFVDTSGWLAYFLSGERYHALADQIYKTAYASSVGIYTSDHIIAELVALLTARNIPRPRVIQEVDVILSDQRVEKLYTDRLVLQNAWDLLKQRADKQWSLVDAISLVWMGRHGISEALTSDHHFEQAGFIRLLK